ncbi:MAG: ComEA family DNA-binding protein [Solirubrobacteraceae bacterium]|nr:ComEA family DNA-binding protein [Solirubrobacteraceae bacterium]
MAGPRQDAVSPAAFGGPGLGTARGSTGSGGGAGAPASTTPKIKRYVVHVAGAVRHPGVYRVRAPGRLIDAVDRAGGLTADADLTQVNLAARLTDGRQIIVPSLAGAAGGGGVAAAGAGSTATTGSGAGGAGAGGGAKVGLNSATAEQLDTLDGVGPAMAAAIIALRTKLGGFTKLEQLDDVPGVGEKRLASLRLQVEL